jgi:hypothetical protein
MAAVCHKARPPVPHTHTASKIIWNRNKGGQRQGSDKIPLASTTPGRRWQAASKGVCVVLAPRRWGLAEPREHAAAIATE